MIVQVPNRLTCGQWDPAEHTAYVRQCRAGLACPQLVTSADVAVLRTAAIVDRLAWSTTIGSVLHAR